MALVEKFRKDDESVPIETLAKSVEKQAKPAVRRPEMMAVLRAMAGENMIMLDEGSDEPNIFFV